MINIGFLEAEKLFPTMNCIMIHDVDKLLLDDRLLMRCDDKVHHYAVTRVLQGTNKRYAALFECLSCKPKPDRLPIETNRLSIQLYHSSLLMRIPKC